MFKASVPTFTENLIRNVSSSSKIIRRFSLWSLRVISEAKWLSSSSTVAMVFRMRLAS